MLTIDSKINKQIVKNLELEGMKISKEKQQRIFDLINSNQYITKEMIREIALKETQKLYLEVIQ